MKCKVHKIYNFIQLYIVVVTGIETGQREIEMHFAIGAIVMLQTYRMPQELSMVPLELMNKLCEIYPQNTSGKWDISEKKMTKIHISMTTFGLAIAGG